MTFCGLPPHFEVGYSVHDPANTSSATNDQPRDRPPGSSSTSFDQVLLANPVGRSRFDSSLSLDRGLLSELVWPYIATLRLQSPTPFISPPPQGHPIPVHPPSRSALAVDPPSASRVSACSSSPSGASLTLVPQTSNLSGRPARARRHVCDVRGCGYSTALRRDLTKHKITHFGPDPHSSYKCPNPGCGKVFGRKENGTRHTRESCPFRMATRS